MHTISREIQKQIIIKPTDLIETTESLSLHSDLQWKVQPWSKRRINATLNGSYN